MKDPKIEWRPLESFRRDPVNPKEHDLAEIRQSITRFGFNEFLVENGATGLLVAGHGRLDVLAQMMRDGEKPPKHVKAKGKTWLVPVVTGISFSSQTEAEAYIVAVNRLVETGGWNRSKLGEMLARIRQNSTLDGIGYRQKELDRLLSSVRNPGEVKEPPAVEVPKTPRVKLGQRWKLGNHFLVCGDCTDPETVKLALDGNLASMMMADPPYGMGKEKEGVQNDNLYRQRLDEFLLRFWQAARANMQPTAAAYVWGNAEDLWRWWYQSLIPWQDEQGEPLTFRNEIVWDKVFGHGQKSGTHRQYPTVTERALFFARGNQGFGNLNLDRYWDGWEPLRGYLAGEAEKMKLTAKLCKEATGTRGMMSHWFTKSQWNLIPEVHYIALRDASGGTAFVRPYNHVREEYDRLRVQWNEWMDRDRGYHDNTHEKLSDIWQHERVKGAERHGHATPKPVKMMAVGVQTSCPPDGWVLEPFGGTGPALLACEQTGRRCGLVELDPRYCDVVIARWEAMTGLTAKPDFGADAVKPRAGKRKTRTTT